MTPAENKALRESMGLTLKWLAERWGVTVQSVKRWEGSRTPPPQIAKDMLDLKRKFDGRRAETRGERWRGRGGAPA